MRTLLLALLAGAVPTAPVLAADPPDSAVTYEDEVLVTGSVPDEDPSDLPATTRVVTREEISARQATSAYELVTTLPGLQGARLGAPGQQASVFLRGAESDHVLVLWDGIPLNNPYFGGFNWAFLPAEGVDRIEVVAGPYGALYGSDAVGGVVNLVTSRDRSVNSLTLEGGENDYLRTGFDAAMSRGDLDLRLGGHLRRGDGEHPNEQFDAESGFSRLGWEVDDGWRLEVLGRTLQAETGIPFASGLPSPERRIAWDEWEIGVPWSGRGERWQLDGLLSAVHYDSRFRDPASSFSSSRTDSEALRGRIAFTRELPSRRRGNGWIAGGVEAERLEVSDRSNFGVNLEGSTQETRSAFVQGHWERPRWTADVGVRYDDNDVFGSAVSPRAGLVFSLRPWARVRASYGEGFRAPSLGELFFPFFGNPDLEPERSSSREVGLSLGRGSWAVDLALFETRFQDLIDFDESFVNVNVGEARSRGLEVAGSVRRELWELSGSVTLLDAENLTSDRPLRRRADETANLRLTLRPGPWTVDLTSRYVSERPDIDPATFEPATNPSFRVHDLAVSRDGGGWIVPYARIENLADEEYSEALGFPAPGRTFVAGVRLSR